MMTREEAKAYIISHCNPDYPEGKTEWETAINMAISALEQPEPHWIPCSERLPETYNHGQDLNSSKTVLVTELDRKGWRNILFGLYSLEEGWIVETCMHGFVRSDAVIAWMPPPEPYKKGE